jgi:hypothetical protein
MMHVVQQSERRWYEYLSAYAEAAFIWVKQEDSKVARSCRRSSCK